MTDATPIDKAKADLAELMKKINGLEMDKNRLENQLTLFYGDKSRIEAFIELSQRYAAPHTETETSTVSEREKASKPPSMASKIAKPAVRTKTKGRRIERKPKDAPTTPDMIREAIAETERRSGKSGADPSEITEFIRNKYWPSAKSSNISPVAWRMWQDGVLKKATNGKYVLPQAA